MCSTNERTVVNYVYSEIQFCTCIELLTVQFSTVGRPEVRFFFFFFLKLLLKPFNDVQKYQVNYNFITDLPVK